MATRHAVPLHRIDARRVAILKPSALGDIVHALPTLEAIRQRFPHSQISWVVNRSFAPLLQSHPCLDEVIPFDRGGLRAGPIHAARYLYGFARLLRQARFDLVLDLQGLLRSGLMARFCGGARRVGFANAREGARHCYSDWIAAPPHRAQHAIDRNWLFAAALGVGDLPRRFRLPHHPESERWVAEQLASLPRPWVVVGAGARWLTKRWPPEHFGVLARRLQERFGGTIVLIGSPDEQPLSRVTHARLAGPSRDWTGTTNLRQLIAVLRTADLMIGNDTGPLHLAAALGCPVVAPYTCTRVHLHGPQGSPARTVETKVACAGSYRKTCADMGCMQELTPDRLWPAVEGGLEAWASRYRSA